MSSDEHIEHIINVKLKLIVRGLHTVVLLEKNL